jgi:hypothetical protein
MHQNLAENGIKNEIKLKFIIKKSKPKAYLIEIKRYWAFLQGLTGSGLLTGRIAPRTPARLNFAAAPPTTVSPATPASTAARGRTAGFVSARRSWWLPPRGLPSTRVRRRARGRDGREAALGAARRSPVAGMEVTGRLTWLRRSCGRRAVGCRATTAATGYEAACGGTQAVASRGGGGSASARAAEQRRGKDVVVTCGRSGKRTAAMLGGARRSRGGCAGEAANGGTRRQRSSGSGAARGRKRSEGVVGRRCSGPVRRRGSGWRGDAGGAAENDKCERGGDGAQVACGSRR